MSLGKITNSFAAATVENSLSLFQFNFDFTFKKTTPPVEYKAVGQALSTNRRLNAENGAAHRTARKLGWLFQQIIPDTPRLLKAYGLRVCELLRTPGINPSGSAADGPFREFVGADCTSLWAAATSGIDALGIHLLACMLARAWDAQTATAIWVELVKSRQVDILQKLGQNHVVSEISVTAARQEFSRAELGDWDASARSWLAQADKALAVKRDQYLLIVKNISLSTGNNKDPYVNVIAAWTLAMTTLEKHLGGISQQVSDGAALFAISAWHLYPDLVYFGSGAKSITFSDPLFEKPATMTLGLSEIATTRENKGTHWSLCLSHLRYYGDPVPVETVQDRTRATISQFRVIVLGAVLESWKVPLHERSDAVRWIHDLWVYLQKNQPFKPVPLAFSRATSWLAVLGQAAESIVQAKEKALEQYEDYLSHGELWGRTFLLYSNPLDPLSEEISEGIRPYFGLCNPMIMRALSEPLDIDAGVEYLRMVAESMGMTEDAGLICYTEIRNGRGYYEYCTVVAHTNSLGGKSHARWLKVADGPSELRGRHVGCQNICHREECLDAKVDDEVDLGYRAKMITARGEQCFTLAEGSLHDRNVFFGTPRQQKTSILFWETPPRLFNSAELGNYICEEVIKDGGLCSCLEPRLPTPNYPGLDYDHCRKLDVAFQRYAGTTHDTGANRESFFELFVRRDLNLPFSTQQYENKDYQATKTNVKPSTGSEWLHSALPLSTRIWDYIERFGDPRGAQKLVMKETTSTPPGLDWNYSHGRAATLISNHIMSPPSADWLRSLELVGVINEIYKDLPGATISLNVLEYPILDAHWAKQPEGSSYSMAGVVPNGTGEILEGMRREETLACIAMMQTGSANIEPEDLSEVMAISADNSIFVAGALLSDPHSIIGPRAIRHIVGNVGYSGLNLMVAPAGMLKIRRPRNEVRTLSNRSKAYDFKRQNNFEGSSLHLSFTGQRLPLISTDIDTIDHGIFLLQAVVSLWDGGKHVADLNLLDVGSATLTRVNLDCSCTKPSAGIKDMDIRCLDSWEDILRPPRRTAIMRAHENWSARLAATAIFIQQEMGHSISVLPAGHLCWTCLEQFFKAPEAHWPEILID